MPNSPNSVPSNENQTNVSPDAGPVNPPVLIAKSRGIGTENTSSGETWKSTLSVSDVATKNPHPPAYRVKPAHWVDEAGTAFLNPWDSFRSHTIPERLGLFVSTAKFPLRPNSAKAKANIGFQVPDWGVETVHSGQHGDIKTNSAAHSDKIKATWLGHACFLVEFPDRDSASPSSPSENRTTRGLRVLFDPVFSARCSPTQIMGPKRFTAPPCKLKDLPEIDIVVISHNHYDHLDTDSIKTLLTRCPSRVPHFFAPRGNEPYFSMLGVPADHIHDLDWWDSKRVVLSFHPSASGPDLTTPTQTRTIEVTCTPCQHFTGRTLWDTFKTLWSSWVVEEVLEPNVRGRPGVKAFFGGDTGYRAVMDGENEDEVPTCPAFKEIGDKFGGFDLALIPIGAYLPRQFMSPFHCAPQDSVRVFKDLNAKKGLGMHWGTWVLTAEDVFDPPKRLAEECRKVGIPEGDFTVCGLGETRMF